MFLSNVSSLGIAVDGIGTQNSTLTIPGDPLLNGTEVTCIASGFLSNDDFYLNQSTAVLYIQGRIVMYYMLIPLYAAHFNALAYLNNHKLTSVGNATLAS